MLSVASWVLALACVSAFNIDVKHPMVYRDPHNQLKSYFGYAVSLLKETGGQGGSWLLVGAPRANSTHPRQTSIYQPGVVYQCKIGETNDTCKSLILDKKEKGRVSNGKYSYFGKKDDAYIGATLDVQGDENGRIVVCGPRWKNQYFEAHSMSGICYSMNGSKDFDKDAENLMPLVNKDKNSIQLEKQSYNDDDLILNYAYGGAGVSVNFVPNSTEMIIGAPGVYDWIGTVIRYKASGARRRIYYDTGLVPDPSKAEKLTPYSYFGYSVGSGKFFGATNKIYYVGGAPRAGNLKGMVYIFDFPDNDEKSPIIEVAIEGFQMGEYFGASICVVDLNSDHLDDLVVGAPQHSLRTLSTLHSTGDEGRIYVFMNKDNGKMSKPRVIMGRTQEGARFGTCISNLGDINKDGFPDIAVGAPYENLGRGAVYIYHGRFDGIHSQFAQHITAEEIDHSIFGFGFSISRGSDIDSNNYLDLAVGAYDSGHAVLLKSVPIITFVAHWNVNVNSLNLNATRFNATACISYNGIHAPSSVGADVILKVDPVYGRANFSIGTDKKSMLKLQVQLNHKDKLCKGYVVEITTLNQDFSKPIELSMEYKLVKSSNKTGNAETFCKSCPVVDPTAPWHTVKKIPYVTGCGETCITDIKLQVLFQDMNMDHENFEAVIIEARTLIGLSQQFITFFYLMQLFKMLGNRYTRNGGTSFLVLQKLAKLNFDADANFRKIIKHFRLPYVIGSTNIIKMKVIMKNTGDPAFLSLANVTFPSMLSLIKVPLNCEESSFSMYSQNESNIHCDMGNPLDTNVTRELILEFDSTMIHTGTENLLFKVKSGSTGNDLEEDDNFNITVIPVKTFADISIKGKSTPEKFYIPKENISYTTKDISFTHLYEVHNLGPSPVHKVNLTFRIPVNIETLTGSFNILKVYKPQEKLNSQSFSCNARGFDFYSNEKKHHISNSSSESHTEVIENRSNENSTRRRKRDNEPVLDDFSLSLSEAVKDKVFYLDCSNRRIECMIVECVIGPLTSKQMTAIIVFPFKISSKAFGPILEKDYHMSVLTSGNLEILDDPHPMEPDNPKPDFADIHTEIKKLRESKLEVWIIALAIIGGLLLFIIITIVLIKMGFFKRHKKEELENLKNQSEAKQNLPENIVAE